MKKILLFIALLTLIVLVMPNVATVYANQHYFYKSANLMCITCHTDIDAQVETANNVNLKHKEAASNYNYTTYLAIGGISYDISTRNITAYGNHVWYWNGSVWINSSDPAQYRNISLDNNGNGAIDNGEICMLCHSDALLGANAHTGTMVLSACDDDRCHGNRNYIYNDPKILNIPANISAAGFNISTDNIHSKYYQTASNQSSNYPAIGLFGYTHGNVNGSYISRGGWTCLGCHSEISTNVTLILSPTYNHSDINAEKGRYQ